MGTTSVVTALSFQLVGSAAVLAYAPSPHHLNPPNALTGLGAAHPGHSLQNLHQNPTNFSNAGGHPAFVFHPASNGPVNGFSTFVSASSPAFLHLLSSDAAGQKFDLDLGSTEESIRGSAVAGLSNASVTIRAGNQQLTVTGNTLLTPAEVAAVYQVLATGHQGLRLDADGAASGGSLRLSPTLLSQISGLVIPQGVSVLEKVGGTGQQISLTDGLTNAGRLIFTGGSRSGGIEIDTSSILNAVGAVITSAPSLTLSASDSVTNSGSIISNGSLNLVANHISATPAAVFQATGSLNVFSPNHADVTLNGGVYRGREINLLLPTGTLRVDVAEMDGPVNVTACNASVAAQHGTLFINSSRISGDPYFASGGDLQLNTASFNTLGDVFVALAGGNITANGTGTIDTSGGPGSQIMIEAGVTYTDPGNGHYVPGGPSATGGNIDLTGVNLKTAGGDVTLLANRVASTGGAVTVGNITTDGNIGHPDAGNVFVVAADTTTIGNISANGADMFSTSLDGGGGGNVKIDITGASLLTVGNIVANGGRGGSTVAGVSGDGGAGGDGGDGYSYDFLPATGGTGGTGGASLPYITGVGIAIGYGGQGGLSDKAGSPGIQGDPGVGKGGDGGKGGTTLASTNSGHAGYDGKNGADGLAGTTGGDGKDGGDGGKIEIHAEGDIIVGAIQSMGGNGGVGTHGGHGGSGGSGGSGGHGDNGTDQPIENPGATVGLAGGTGGAGGNGGDGGDGGEGGEGGKGGKGGEGGEISIVTDGSLTFHTPLGTVYALDARGGIGGSGGAGGVGGSGGNGGSGGEGGRGGASQKGGSKFNYDRTVDGVDLGTLTTFSPGNGGDGGDSGKGGAGGAGGDGGGGGEGGEGGAGGSVTLSGSSIVSNYTFKGSTFEQVFIASVVGGSGGNGGPGATPGNGGFGGDGGKAGQAGFSMKQQYTDNTPVNSALESPANPPALAPDGALGKYINGGKGGDAGTAGDGGTGGDAGHSGVFGLGTHNIKIGSIDGTTAWDPAAVKVHVFAAAPGAGGPAGYVNPDFAYQGLGGTTYLQTDPAEAGDPVILGNEGLKGKLTLPTAIQFPPAGVPLGPLDHSGGVDHHGGGGTNQGAAFQGWIDAGKATVSTFDTLNSGGKFSALMDFAAPFPTGVLAYTPQPESPSALTSAISDAPSESIPQTALISPAKQTEIATKYGTVRIAPGSMVLLVGAEDGLAVYDLHDDKTGSVTVETGNHSFTLVPGKHLTFSRYRRADFARANKLPFVLYRSPVRHRISDEQFCYCGDYSVASLVANFAPFSAMLASSDARTQKLAKNTLKTAAILHQLTAGSKPYELMVQVSRLAMAK
ncbi:MAG: hypothetical protein JSS83_01300 [Cyanobacteria bacterium SZAS LIN-3]|nr:hypothetical protein [Cyanobacteria bacterium SZAS LIN-3]MBS2005639.1 hypothetical protein [Cyanobacteria bacterium SZAS TMP-1]